MRSLAGDRGSYREVAARGVGRFLLVAFLLLLASLTSVAPAEARSSGVSGYSNPATAAVGCYGCHKSADGGEQDHALINPAFLPTVTISGPTSLAPSALGTYTVTVKAGASSPASHAGIVISVEDASFNLVGTLAPNAAETNLKVTTGGESVTYTPRAGELTHNPKKAMSGGQASFTFDWTAPSTPGTYDVRAISNAVNNGNGSSNDDNDWAVPLTVTVASSDTDPPLAPSITYPTSSSTLNDSPTVNIQGTASDAAGPDATGIDTVKVMIQRSSDSRWWNQAGTSWDVAEVENDAGGFTPGTMTVSYSFAWNRPAQDGGSPTYTITARAYDGQPNVSPDSPPVTNITIDNVAPAGTIAINNGDAATNNTAVVIDNTSISGSPTQMRFADTQAGLSGASWTAYTATAAYTIPTGDGTKTVWGEFVDAATNTYETSDTITLDTVGPTGTIAINNGDAATNNTAVVIDNTSISGSPTQMRFADTQAGLSGASWTAYTATAAYTLPAGEGAKTVWGEFMDAATNTYETSDGITLDQTPPAGTIAINNGDAATNNTAVVIDSTSITGSPTQMRFADTQAGLSGASWTAYTATAAYTIPTGDGTKTVWGEFMDAATNTYETSDTITLDTVGPTGTIAINSGATYTTVTAVTVNNSISGATQMRFADTSGGLAGATWEAYAATKPWTLPGGDGTKTVWAEFKDDAGNTYTQNDDIILDQTPPSGTIAINNGDAMTNDANVVINNSISGSPVDMRFANTQGELTTAGWTAYVSTAAYTLPAGDGTKTVWGQFRDAAGNTYDTSDDILLDASPPTGSIAIDGGATYASAAGVTVNNSITDANDMRFANTQGELTTASWEPYSATKAWTLPGGDGSKTVWAQFRDVGLNVLETNDSIILDTTGPTVQTGDVIPAEGATGVVINTNITVDFTEANEIDQSTLVDANVYLTQPPSPTHIAASISYDDINKRLTLNPDADLTDLTTYEATITIGVLDLAGNPLQAQKQWQFTTAAAADTQGPTSSITAPITSETISGVGPYSINGGATDASTGGSDITGVQIKIIKTGAPNEYWNGSGWTTTDTALNATIIGSGTTVTWQYSWAVPQGETGTLTIQSRATDSAGNPEAAWNTVTGVNLDTQAPTGTMVVDSDAAYATSTAVTINNAMTDAADMRFANTQGELTTASWEAYAATKPWTLPSGDGTKTVWGQFRDGNGNVQELSDDIILDETPPAGNIAIDAGATYAMTTAVSIDNSITGATQMRFADTQAGLSGASWEAYAASKAYTVPGGDGTKTVWGEFRDAAGNTYEASDDIILDQTPPSGSIAINGGASATNDINVTINNSISGATQMRFADTQAGLAAAIWTAYASTEAYSVPAGDGTKTVWGEFKDDAGNTFQTSDDITLDTVGPSGSLVINNNDAFTNTTGVTINNSITGATQMRFADTSGGLASATWTAYTATAAYTLPAGDGSKTVWGEFKDDASNTFQASDSITLDTGGPTGSIAIESGATYATNANVTINNSITGATQMRFADTQGELTTASYEPYAATKAWLLTGGQGTNTVWAEFKDDASNTFQTSDDIILDTQAPTGTFVVNNDDPATNNLNVTLNSSVTGATWMRFGNSAGEASSGVNTAAYSATVPHTLQAGDGPKTVFVEYLDDAGNILALNDGITYDSVPPSGTIAINNGNAATGSTAVTINNSISGASEMRFANTSGGLASASWSAYNSTAPYTLPTGDGTKTVWGEFKDLAGNTYQTSDNIVLDTSGPTGGFVINNDATYTNTTGVTLNNSITDVVDMRFADTQAGLSSAGWVGSYSASYPYTLPGGDGTKTVWAEFIDNNSNTFQTSDDIILDQTPAAVPSNLHVTFTGAYSVGLGWDAVAEAVSYQIWRDASLKGTSPSNSYLDRDVAPSTSYTYTVRSVDAAGNVSSDSSPLIVDSIPDPIIDPIGGWWTEYGRNSGDPSDTRAELGPDFDPYSPNTPTSGVTPSPHGDYTTTTNKCKTCHAVHRGNTDSFRLLHDNSRWTECDWCHNASTGRSSHRPYGEMGLRGFTVRGEHTLGATRVPDSEINGGGGGWGNLPDRGDGTSPPGLNCYYCHSVHGAETLYVNDDPVTLSDGQERWRQAILRNDPARNGNPGYIIDHTGASQPFDAVVMSRESYDRAYFCGDCHNKNPNYGIDIQGNDPNGGTDVNGLQSRPNPTSHPTRGDGFMEIYGRTGTAPENQVSWGLDDCTSCHGATTFTNTASRNPGGPSDFPHQSQGHKLLEDDYVDADLPGAGGDPMRPLPSMDQVCLGCHEDFVGISF